ncbi:MAG TPA: tetratricopeptide repeat protein [Acidobacteriota bacterium]|nr:tetratricopeptide repeat protein [Acidobacteriota bacterium]
MVRLVVIGVLVAVLATAGMAQPAEAGNESGDQINRLIREHRLAEAETLAAQWAEREPGPASYYALGMVLFEKRDYMQAYTVLNKALQGAVSAPVMARTFTMLGLIDYQFGNYQAALRWFAQARRLPRLPAAQLRQIEELFAKISLEKELAGWRTRPTSQIVFHYPEQADLEPVVDRLQRDYTALVQSFCREHKLPEDPRIHFYYYPDETLFRRLQPDAPHTFILLQEQVIHGWPEARLRHEFMHLLVWRINRRNYPSFLITEGLTEYLNRREQPERWHQPAARIVQSRELPTLAELERIDCYRNNPWVFDLVCSFTAFLVDQVGWAKYLEFWHRGQGLDKDFPACFGAPLAELWTRWAASLQQVPVSEFSVWGNFRDEILAPGLYADGVRMLESRTDLSPLGRLMLARVLAGADRPADARAAVRDFADRPESLRAMLPAAAWADGLLLAGQLWDVAGERDRALQFYDAVTDLPDCPETVRAAAATHRLTPCQPQDFRPRPEPNAVDRADHLIRFWIQAGLSTDHLAAAISQGLDDEKMERLGHNLGLAPPGALRDAVRQHLTGKIPEDCLRQVLAAGISILDVRECLERNGQPVRFPPAAGGRP